jgi:hypothetical protein
MIAIVLIAIAAGCASALMFASIISGALISVLLFYLAPLPLMVAALAWGPLCATIGGIAAATGLGVIFGIPYCIAFAVSVALAHRQRRPVWQRRVAGCTRSGMVSGWPNSGLDRRLCRVDDDGRPAHAWLGCDRDQRRTAARPVADHRPARCGVDRRDRTMGRRSRDHRTSFGRRGRHDDADAQPLARHQNHDDIRTIAPPADLPPMTLAALCVAIAFCFAGGLLAILAQIVAAVLMTAYALAGFAVLHTLTLTLKSRALWLGCTYAIVAVFLWPVLAMVVLGLADAIFGFRKRYLQGRPPPLPAA